MTGEAWFISLVERLVERDPVGFLAAKSNCPDNVELHFETTLLLQAISGYLALEVFDTFAEHVTIESSEAPEPMEASDWLGRLELFGAGCSSLSEFLEFLRRRPPSVPMTPERSIQLASITQTVETERVRELVTEAIAARGGDA